MNHIAALLHLATLSASRALYRLAYWVGVVTVSLVCATLLLSFVVGPAKFIFNLRTPGEVHKNWFFDNST